MMSRAGPANSRSMTSSPINNHEFEGSSKNSFIWGGKIVKGKNNAITSTPTSLPPSMKTNQRSNFPMGSFISKENPEVYIDAQSNGLTSRIVMYSEQSNRRQKPLSCKLYSRSGEYPIVRFDKSQITYKPRRNLSLSSSASSVKILPPVKSTYETNVRSEILRTGHLTLPSESVVNKPPVFQRSQINEPLSPSHPPDDPSQTGTRSVLDALKEISRKRIHCNDIHVDHIKKYKENEDILDGNKQPSVVKRQRDSPILARSASVDGIDGLQKRICTKNNDILSSLSSSIQLNSTKRKIDTSVETGGKSKINCIGQQQNSIPSESHQKPKHLPEKLQPNSIDTKSNIEGKPVNNVAPREMPKITLFSKNYANSPPILPKSTPSQCDSDDDTPNISFIKPKEDAPAESTLATGYLKPAEKSKLQLLMSWLNGDSSDDEDTVDAVTKKSNTENTETSTGVNVLNAEAVTAVSKESDNSTVKSVLTTDGKVNNSNEMTKVTEKQSQPTIQFSIPPNTNATEKQTQPNLQFTIPLDQSASKTLNESPSLSQFTNNSTQLAKAIPLNSSVTHATLSPISTSHSISPTSSTVTQFQSIIPKAADTINQLKTSEPSIIPPTTNSPIKTMPISFPAFTSESPNQQQSLISTTKNDRIGGFSFSPSSATTTLTRSSPIQANNPTISGVSFTSNSFIPATTSISATTAINFSSNDSQPNNSFVQQKPLSQTTSVPGIAKLPSNNLNKQSSMFSFRNQNNQQIEPGAALFSFGAKPSNNPTGTSIPSQIPINPTSLNSTKSAFTFGDPKPASTAVNNVTSNLPPSNLTSAASSTNMFSFGQTTSIGSTPATTSASTFSFGQTKGPSAPTSTTTSSFSFGQSQSTFGTTTTTSLPSSFSTVTSVGTAQNTAGPFSFGGKMDANSATSGIITASASAPTSSAFSFGKTVTGENKPNSNPMTTSSSSSSSPPQPIFGSTTPALTTGPSNFGLFGVPPNNDASKVSQKPSVGFGSTLSNNNSASTGSPAAPFAFGANTSTQPTFGQTTTMNKGIFGAQTQTAAQPSNSVKPPTMSAANIFGGAPTPQSSNANMFSNSSNVPSNLVTSQPLFGSQKQDQSQKPSDIASVATVSPFSFGSSAAKPPTSNLFSFGGQQQQQQQQPQQQQQQQPLKSSLGANETAPMNNVSFSTEPTKATSLFQNSNPNPSLTSSNSNVFSFGGGSNPAATSPSFFQSSNAAESSTPKPFVFGGSTSGGNGNQQHQQQQQSPFGMNNNPVTNFQSPNATFSMGNSMGNQMASPMASPIGTAMGGNLFNIGSSTPSSRGRPMRQARRINK